MDAFDFVTHTIQMVINIGSVAGREAYAGGEPHHICITLSEIDGQIGSIYCATKHALSAFNGSLLRELINTPIRVCEIQPGILCLSCSIAD